MIQMNSTPEETIGNLAFNHSGSVSLEEAVNETLSKAIHYFPSCAKLIEQGGILKPIIDGYKENGNPIAKVDIPLPLYEIIGNAINPEVRLYFSNEGLRNSAQDFPESLKKAVEKTTGPLLVTPQVYIKITGYASYNNPKKLLELAQDNPYGQIDVDALKTKIKKRKEITRVIEFKK